MRGISSIPDGWGVLPLKTFLRPRAERDNVDLTLLSVYRDHGVVPFGSIEGNHNKPSLDLSNYKTVREGDLVLNKMKTWQGSLAVSDHEGLVSPAYVVCKVSGDWDRRYLHHLLRSPSFVAEYASLSYGIRVGQWDMRFEDFREVLALHPPIETQRRIVDYLDSEIARIDSLIDRKQRFIDLLLEKRTALITHAVTKGLDPDVEMKDSGIDWIGRVPRHWVVGQLKHATSQVIAGGTPASDDPRYWAEDDKGIAWVAIGDMSKVDRVAATAKRITHAGKTAARLRLLPAGTLVYSMYASLGKVALLEIDACTNQAILGLALADRSDVRFMLWWLNALEPHVRLVAGSNTQDNLNADSVRRLPIVLPPLDEQRMIAHHIDENTALVDRLVDRTRKSIDLLKEYRTALISAAVTGQIEIPAAGSGEDVA